MTDPASQGDELLLQQLSLGELDADDHELQSRRGASPAFARACDEILELRSRLDKSAAGERGVLRESQSAITTADRELVERAVAAARSAHPTVSGRRRPWWFLLAAASLLLATWTLYDLGDSEDPQPGDGMLESSGAHTPQGPVSEFVSFTIDHPREDWTNVEVTVYDQSGTVLLRSPLLDEPEWNLTPQEQRLLDPVERIEWTYRVNDPFDDSGGTLHGPFRAWRAP